MRVLIAVLLLTPVQVFAHGIGQRIDLPIPLDVYLGAAAIVIIVSFLLIGFLGKRERTYESYPSRDLLSLKWVKAVFTSSLLRLVLKIGSVLFLGMLLFAGFWGDQTPTDNILPVFVWVGFTVALTYFIALVGNIWPAINPWSAIHEWIFRKDKKRLAWHYGMWPAVVLFFSFRWLENVYPQATDPLILAGIIAGYSVITFLGMTLFGRTVWLKNADPFSVFFRFISHFAILNWEERDGKKILRLRLPAVGFLRKEKMSPSEGVFVLLALAGVSFDGIASTAFAVSILNAFRDIGLSLIAAKTLLFVGVFLTFVVVYLVFSVLIRNYAQSDSSVSAVAKQFVLSLMPIAIVYEVAHFMALLLTEGQRLFILVSDPFGYDWNAFGTALQTVNYGFIDFKLLWNIQIGLILFGHVTSLYIAHIVAVRLFKNSNVAFKSQIPMLVLMVAYTVMGLWILAQPPVIVN